MKMVTNSVGVMKLIRTSTEFEERKRAGDSFSDAVLENGKVYSCDGFCFGDPDGNFVEPSPKDFRQFFTSASGVVEEPCAICDEESMSIIGENERLYLCKCNCGEYHFYTKFNDEIESVTKEDFVLE